MLESIEGFAIANKQKTRIKIVREHYNFIEKRRGKKRAIIAITRMILTAIYPMFCTGEVWNIG